MFVRPVAKEMHVKFLCLGYYDPAKHAALTESERTAMYDECFAYDDHLRANRQFGPGEALQLPETARTLRRKNGKTLVTDGPYAETKEQIGGIGVLEARAMDHAIELISQHPALKYGTVWELRPIFDMSEIIQASEQRRQKTDAR